MTIAKAKPPLLRKTAHEVVEIATKAPKLAKSVATSGDSKALPKRRTGLTREKILSVATRLFAERGYAAISIRDIAGECSIGIPSIYHFFGDKDSLYVSCCEKQFGEVEAALTGSFREAASSQGRVYNLTLALCNILLKNKDFRRLLQMGLLQDAHRGIEDITVEHFKAVFKLLSDGIRELDGDRDPKERALLIFALTFGQLQLHRVTQMADANITHGSNPVKLAQYVLRVALPNYDWVA